MICTVLLSAHRRVRCALAFVVVTSLAAICSSALSLPAFAAADTPPDADATLSADRQTVERIEKRLNGEPPADIDLPETRRQLLEVRERASAIAAEQAPQLQSTQARMAELGPAPEAGDAPDVAARRKELQKSVGEIDSRVKLARLLVLTSEQLAETASARARERFADDLLTPTDPLLGARFRDSVRAGFDSDGPRLRRAFADLRTFLSATSLPAWLGLAGLLAALVGLRSVLGRVLDHALVGKAPSGRLRRSLLVLASSALAMLVPGGAMLIVAIAARDAIPALWSPLLADAVGLAGFCAFVAGRGRTLLAPRRPTWRLPPLSDETALRVRHMPSILAMIVFTGWLLQRLTELARLSLPALVVVKAGLALAMTLALLRLLTLLRDARTGEGARSTAALLIPGVARVVLAVTTIAIFAGYVALGSFVVGQLVWILILGCSGYALWVFIEDAATAWATYHAAEDAQEGAPARATLRRRQLAVLVSGVLRVLLLLVILVLLLAPFGAGPTELLGRGLRWQNGVTIGKLELRPGTIAQAILVGVLTFALARAFRRWVADRLLPTTTMDAGMRNSIVTLVGFVGGIVAVAMALSAVGLALTQVAWIASALTVGIGFGMQAIVSNFVSGLILLAERPVKVGDWVALGGLEGDIRRMNVRTTEIQMADRSTVIVPNSEFITKVVRNVTHDSLAQGLVQIRMPMPLDADTERVRTTLLEAMREHPEILQDPAANVLLEGVEGDKLVFNATGFVASPRRVAAVRSALLFQVMPRLRAPPGPAGA